MEYVITLVAAALIFRAGMDIHDAREEYEQSDLELKEHCHSYNEDESTWDLPEYEFEKSTLTAGEIDKEFDKLLNKDDPPLKEQVVEN